MYQLWYKPQNTIDHNNTHSSKDKKTTLKGPLFSFTVIRISIKPVSPFFHCSTDD